MKWIYKRNLTPTGLPGGIVANSKFVVMNGYDNVTHELHTNFYYSTDTIDETEALFEAEKSYIKAAGTIAYQLGIGLVTRVDRDSLKFYLREIKSLDVKKEPNIEYILPLKSKDYSPNDFMRRSEIIYDQFKDDLYAHQAGIFLNTAYALYGNTMDAIVNFTKVIETIIRAICGTDRYKLQGKNLNILKSKLNLSENEIKEIKELGEARDKIAAHGVIDPELEYIFGKYKKDGKLNKYFVVGCGPMYSLRDFLITHELVVRKVFSKYLGIDYIASPKGFISEAKS